MKYDNQVNHLRTILTAYSVATCIMPTKKMKNIPILWECEVPKVASLNTSLFIHDMVS